MSNPVNINSPIQYLAMETEFNTFWDEHRDATDPEIRAHVAQWLDRHVAADFHSDLPHDTITYIQFRADKHGRYWDGSAEYLLKGRY